MRSGKCYFPNITASERKKCLALLNNPLHKNETGVYDPMNCRGHGNSQEFDLISPEMFMYFLLEYQKKIKQKAYEILRYFVNMI